MRKEQIIKTGITILLLCFTIVLIAGKGCCLWWRKKKDHDVITGSSAPPSLAGWTKTSNPSTTTDEPHAIAVDENYVYIAGCNNNDNDAQWHIEKRAKTTGALDTNFGIYNTGVVTSNVIAWLDMARSIIADDNYIYIAGSDYGGDQWRIEKRDKDTGVLDTNFGIYNSGVVTNNYSIFMNYEEAHSIIADENYLYIAGCNNNDNDAQWHIEKRHIITGGLVSGFGISIDGVITSDGGVAGRNDIAFSITADDTYLYIAGCDESPGMFDYQWRIEKRHIITGGLVSGFGIYNTGVVTSNPSAWMDIATSITADDDYLYIFGWDGSPEIGYAQWRIEKRDKDTGALVGTFDSDGVVEGIYYNQTVLIIGEEHPYAIAVDGDYLYLAGYDASPGNVQWRIEKRDKTTGNSGSEITSFPEWPRTPNPSVSANDDSYSVTADTDYLYIAGNESGAWHIEKRAKTTGALDTDFGAALGTSGWITSDPSGSADIPYSITADNTYLYIAGHDTGEAQWRIEKRYKISGTLVTDFGTDGVVSINPSGSVDVARSIIADTNYLYIAGYDSPGGDHQWRIEKRYIITGGLVSGFGISIDGVVTSNPNAPSSDEANSIAADDDYLYIAGFDAGGTKQWRIEKRHIITGGLVSGFGIYNTGVVTSNPSGGSDIAYSITVDGNYLYIAGYDNQPGDNYQWRIEKYNKTTGILDETFGTSGVLTTNPGDGTSLMDEAYFITVDGSYLYITGRDESQGASDDQWRIEKRDKTSGNLVGGFGTGGVVTINPSSSADTARSIIADDTYLYIAGYDKCLSNARWRIEKRLKTTGGQ